MKKGYQKYSTEHIAQQPCCENVVSSLFFMRSMSMFMQ
jgi:hypothetical protein